MKLQNSAWLDLHHEYIGVLFSIKGNRQVVNGLFLGGDSIEDQLTTNCKLFDQSFALHNRKCGGWDGCVRLKPMPLLPLPLLWARIINEKYIMSRLLDCRSRGLQASCAVVTLRALRDETKTAALETIEGRPQNKFDH